jgi:hypothetical protein
MKRTSLSLVALVLTSSHVHAGWFSNWKPITKPLQPAQKAASDLQRLTNTASAAKQQVNQQSSVKATQDTAAKNIDQIATKVETIVKDRQVTEEALANSERREQIFSVALLAVIVPAVLKVYEFVRGHRKATIDELIARLTLEELERKIEDRKKLESASAEETAI